MDISIELSNSKTILISGCAIHTNLYWIYLSFPAKFIGSHLVVSADGTKKALETLVTVFHPDTGAAPKELRVLVDGNIWKKNTDTIKV